MKKNKPGELYKYGCVMIELNITDWDKLSDLIDPIDVYLPDDPVYGIETNPHVTSLYGLHNGVTIEQVKKIFDDCHLEINVEINGIGVFENDKFDVVKLNVINNGSIQYLHDKLCEFPNTVEYPTYCPHITLAYVNKGCGKKYIREYKLLINNIGKVKYTTPNGDKSYFDIK